MSLINLYKSSIKAFISISSHIYRTPKSKSFCLDKHNLEIFKKDFINRLNFEGDFPSEDFDRLYEIVKKDPYLSEAKINKYIDKIFVFNNN